MNEAQIALTLHDLELLRVALAMAASRREAEARFNWPRASAKRADEQAMTFRALRHRLLRERAELVKETGDGLGR